MKSSPIDSQIKKMVSFVHHAPIQNSTGDSLEPHEACLTASVERHLATGILHAERKDFERAVCRFQQACAFVTDHFGITPWFARYLENFRQPRTHALRLPMRIYENLSRCLLRLGRFTDAGLMADAAMKLLPGKKSLYTLREQIDAASHTVQTTESSQYRRMSPRLQNAFWTDQITLVMVTHFTDKLSLNRRLSPPGTGLVQKTFASMIEVLGSEIKKCPKIMIYDRKHDSDPDEKAYRKNLLTFASTNGFDLLEIYRGGLQHNMATAIEKIQTPYTLWVEHDWEFLPPGVNLAEMVNAFEQYRHINMIRFNKRRNAVAGFDFLLVQENAVEKINLLRTSAYSNNPQLVRTEKFRNHWLPLCRSDAVAKNYDLSCTAFGVEEPLFRNIVKDIRQSGFEVAHSRWGTYVYGGANDPPRIRHLGC